MQEQDADDYENIEKIFSVEGLEGMYRKHKIKQLIKFFRRLYFIFKEKRMILRKEKKQVCPLSVRKAKKRKKNFR